MSSEKTLETPYTFETVFRTVEKPSWMLGIFIRSGIVKDPLFPNFEVDAYDGANGSMGLGGSGMTIAIEEDGIDLRIKNYQDDGSHVSNTYYDFTGIEGYQSPAENFNKITIADEGTRIVISINEKLLATVELSDIGTYETDTEKPPVDFVYYKTAVLKNAAGEEVVKINNARVVAEEYMSAIGVRNGKLDIDNIVISYEEEQPDPTEEPEETAAPTANASTEKPDTCLLYTSPSPRDS